MTNKTFAERQDEAARALLAERRNMFSRIESLLGLSRHHLLIEVHPVGENDFIAEVDLRGSIGHAWCAIANGARTPQFWLSQDEALLHLVALRRLGRIHADIAVPFALRVLTAPREDG